MQTRTVLNPWFARGLCEWRRQQQQWTWNKRKARSSCVIEHIYIALNEWFRRFTMKKPPFNQNFKARMHVILWIDNSLVHESISMSLELACVFCENKTSEYKHDQRCDEILCFAKPPNPIRRDQPFCVTLIWQCACDVYLARPNVVRERERVGKKCKTSFDTSLTSCGWGGDVE